MACSQSSLRKARWRKCQSFIETLDSSNLVPTVSSHELFKQLPSSTLKVKIIDAHKTGEGYKIAKYFVIVIKKWQLRGTEGVKLRPDQENFQRELIRGLKENQIERGGLTAKDLQEDLSGFGSAGALFNCEATPAQIWTSWKSHWKNLSCILTTKFSVKSLQTSLKHSEN